jgi:hypothetical protein
MNKRTKIVVDASPIGAEALLSQYELSNPKEEDLNAAASRKFSEIEQRYSQVERESPVSLGL